jgi:signal transduction histidine kinase
MFIYSNSLNTMLDLVRSYWYLVSILVVILSSYLLITAAQRTGRRSAREHIQRWLHLPAAILQYFETTSVEAALIGLMDTLAGTIQAGGSIVLIGRTEDKTAGTGMTFRTLAAEGSFRCLSEYKIEEAFPDEAILHRLVKGGAKPAVLTRIHPDELSDSLLALCPGLGANPLLLIRFQLHFAAFKTQDAIGLMLFEADPAEIDSLGEEIISSAVAAFPRMLETMTMRFAHAEELERKLEQSKRKDLILKQLLCGFQHDISHALSNVEEGVISAAEMVDSMKEPQFGETPAVHFQSILSALRLTSQVAASGTVLVEIAEGSSALVSVEQCDPETLFISTIQPVLSLRKRTRRDLAVHVEISPDLPPIRVDRVAFFRALSNVIHNAFKFTVDGGIRVFVYARGNEVIFAISDTGPGIPEDEICSLGKSGFRGSNLEKVSGSGLGLWTTVQLLEAMGGWLEVRSKRGVGSTFLLHFPSVKPYDMDTGRREKEADKS